MNKTLIEWVKNPDGTQGYTWNPITGCLNGCEYCYARKLANTRLKRVYLANKNFIADTDITPKTDPFYPRFWPERMWLHQLVGSKRKPRGIFTCDMSDLFGIGVPEDWTRRVLNVIRQHPRHRFYLLTKQPQNLPPWSPFPENCWVGVTATDNQAYREAIVALAHIEVKIRYISFEPLLENIKVNAFNDFIDWVIIGALTGTKKELLPLHHKTGLMMVKLNGNRWSLQPQIEWVEEIVRAADKTGVKVFLKENLKPLLDGNIQLARNCIVCGEDKKAKLRQVMPKGREARDERE